MHMSNSTDDWQPRKMPALLIAKAARFLARLADTRFRDLGISMSQFPVLMALKNGARLSQKELTLLAGVEQPSMAQLLARMERDGLIRREPDPVDGRSSLISLSQVAMGKILPARTVLAQGNQDALAGFDDAEIVTLVSLLLRVIANVNDDAEWCPTGKPDAATSAPDHADGT